MSTQFIDALQELFLEKADENYASQSKAYMKNHGEFIGIRAAERQAITKLVLKEIAFPSIEEVELCVATLWQMDKREYLYAAIQLLAFYKKKWRIETIQLIESCISKHSWWDTVDGLNSECVSPYFKLYPETLSITTRWNESNNMWLQRSSIIFQKSYRTQTHLHLLTKHILHCANSKEFFIQKAIGWALREYAKTNAQWVLDFVANHQLPNLSKREALKHL
jgi:3-methyladenine DNA glycosylase AlkD